MKPARIALAFLPALLFFGSVQAQESWENVHRVGGDVSPPDVSPPQVIRKVDPEYSEQARKAKCQGAVVLNLVVQRDGTVRNVRVAQSLDVGLDAKAIEAVQQWRFQPGMKDGEPVDVAAIVEVTFRMMDRKNSPISDQGDCYPVDPTAYVDSGGAINVADPPDQRDQQDFPEPRQILTNIYLESLALLLTKITEDQQAVFWNSLNQQTLKALREEEDEKRREEILQAHRDFENSVRQHQANLK